MDSLRRVVVTGIGAVTPIGLTFPEFWKNALAGKSGVGQIEAFDTSEYSVTIAGEIKDFDPDSDYGPALTLYCENNTDQNLSFSMDDVSVNGFMCDPYWAVTIWPHAKSYSTATWYTDDLTENGITQFENVEFKLRVYDADDWSSNDLLSETYTLTF